LAYTLLNLLREPTQSYVLGSKKFHDGLIDLVCFLVCH
jgi:hypothetical protein